MTKAEALRKAFAERNGVPAIGVPDQPKFDIGVQWYLDTFSRLSSSRSTGFGIGYIPTSEIILYAKEVGTIEDSIEDFIDVISAMDAIYVKETNKKTK